MGTIPIAVYYSSASLQEMKSLNDRIRLTAKEYATPYVTVVQKSQAKHKVTHTTTILDVVL